ncbi:MAG: hypothetical protein WC477_03460 [Patescibacteria group bacterium]
MPPKKSKPVRCKPDCCKEYHTYGDAPLRIIFVALLVLLLWLTGYVLLRLTYQDRALDQQYGAWAQVSVHMTRLERTIDELKTKAANIPTSATSTGQE